MEIYGNMRTHSERASTGCASARSRVHRRGGARVDVQHRLFQRSLGTRDVMGLLQTLVFKVARAATQTDLRVCFGAGRPQGCGVRLMMQAKAKEFYSQDVAQRFAKQAVYSLIHEGIFCGLLPRTPFAYCLVALRLDWKVQPQ